jgi:hypothetical protein
MTTLTVFFYNFPNPLKIKIDRPASSGSQENYDGWLWPLLEAALSIF